MFNWGNLGINTIILSQAQDLKRDVPNTKEIVNRYTEAVRV
jgi:hypothetical protein